MLWLTEVQGVDPHTAAAVLGVSTNGLSQLIVRSRTCLRERYLQAHGQSKIADDCQPVAEHLNAYVTGPNSDYNLYMQATDGSSPALIGQGAGLALSFDGKSALALDPIHLDHLRIIPTGVGESSSLSAPPGLNYSIGTWMPDGKTFVGYMTEMADMRRNRGYVLEGQSFTPFDVPNSTSTTAIDINAAGAIVGVFEAPAGKTHGFIRESGQYTTRDGPGSKGTSAWSINSAGTIVGAFVDAGGVTRGFVANRK